MELKDKKIVIGITGGIAAYKAAALIRLFKKAGADVYPIMTPAAKSFIGSVTIQALAEHPAPSDTFESHSENGIDHINIVADADLMVIAPATANTIAKLRTGLADNLLTSIALAAPCPILIAPAMNKHMYANPATQENIMVLKARGYIVVGPDNGFQACGDVGSGRMSEPEEIYAAAVEKLTITPCSLLNNKKVVITAGPTVENIDPVRFISNKSSGKMGYALAEAAKEAGADVTLISGPVNIDAPAGVTCSKISSADEMLKAVQKHTPNIDIFIACAAVADFKMSHVSEHKIKKTPEQDTLTLTLVKNPDILALTGNAKDRPKIVVGFAAETDHIEEHALSKLERKNADFIIANDVSIQGLGFGSNDNKVTVYAKDASKIEIGPAPKIDISRKLISILAQKLKQ